MSPNPIETILNVEPLSASFTCVGSTNEGSRCRNIIASYNCENANVILNRLNRLSLENIEDRYLTTLSSYVLCRRWHNGGSHGQRERMVSLWKQKIQIEIRQRASPQAHASATRSIVTESEPNTAWNPAKILFGDMGEDFFTCVGETKRGTRCKLTIAKGDRDDVHCILRELRRADYKSNLDDKLEELAELALCTRWHSKPSHSQVSRMVRIWKTEIEAYKLRVARTQISTPVGYLPTPPQSRSATPAVTTPARSQDLRSARLPETPPATISRPARPNGQLITPPSSPIATPETTQPSSVEAIVERNENARTRPRLEAYRDRNAAIESTPTRSSHRRSILPQSTSVSNSAPLANVEFPSVPDTEPSRQRQPLLEQGQLSEPQQPVLEAVSVTVTNTSTISSSTPALPLPNTRTPPERVTPSSSDTLTSTDSRVFATSGESVPATAANEETQPEQHSRTTLPVPPTEPLNCANQDLHRSRRHHLPDNCFVCLEDMSRTEDLVWCKARCGKNIHRECWVAWTERAEGDNGLRCPHCRTPWDFTACPCDEEPPLVEQPTDLVDIWTRLPPAAQANLLWGPLPPPPRLEYRSSS